MAEFVPRYDRLVRIEVGKAERVLRGGLLALAAAPLLAQALVRVVWFKPYHGHLELLPAPTEFVLDGWPSLFSILVLLAAFVALGKVRRTVVRVSGETIAAIVLLVVATACGVAVVIPWFSWGGMVK